MTGPQASPHETRLLRILGLLLFRLFCKTHMWGLPSMLFLFLCEDQGWQENPAISPVQ